MRAVAMLLALASSTERGATGREMQESDRGHGAMRAPPSVQEAGSVASGGDAAPLALPRLSGPIELDGRLDEPAWADVDRLPMVTVRPEAGREPGAPTDIRVAYDETHIYLGGRLGTGPDGPTVHTFVRDRWADGDAVELVLDTYGDNESAVIFTVNPAGNRIDAEVSDDAEFTYGFPVNDSWNAFWDAATGREEGAWTVEMRIPFSSLRFQSDDGRVVMGMIVHRYIARLNESSTFPAIDPSWNLGVNKPSVARDVALDGVRPARPVYASPYVLGGIERRWESADADGPFPGSETWTREIGGDVRFALTDHLNLDLTVNTDFAQVEADDREVNLTRFDLFFPEKRQFFQERAGLFEFRTGRGNRLFHSRRIGIVDGRHVRILGGGRVVGRIGPWDVGALDMQTDASDGTGSENFGVLRVRRRVLNDFSTVGGMVTTRIGARSTNTAYGLEGSLWLGSGRYLSLRWAQSFDDGNGGLPSSTAQVVIEDRDRRGLGYRLSIGRTGDRYDPAVGFVQRRDYREASGDLTWGIFGGERSPVERWGPRIEATWLVGETDGALETAELSTGWELELKSGALLSGGVVTTRERLDEEFVLEPVVAGVPPGRHDFVWGRMFARTPPSSAFSASLFARAGGFFDGTIVSATLSPLWRPSAHVEIGADLERSHIRFGARDQTFDASLLRLRTTLAWNARLSAEAFVQFSSVDDVVLANLRVRYNVSEGRDLWVVFNESRNTGRVAHGPTPPPVRDRTLLIKYTHTLRVF